MEYSVKKRQDYINYSMKNSRTLKELCSSLSRIIPPFYYISVKNEVSVKKDRGDIIRDIKKVLKGFKEIVFAYCFGSFLDKEAFNDIDMALYMSVHMRG